MGLKVNVKRIEENKHPLPEYQTKGSAGFDLRANLREPIILKHGQIKLIPTGLVFEIPEGYEVEIRPRSGLAAKHGISIVNTPGTIDSDYRGEIKIILINQGKDDFTVNDGERVAQGLLKKVEQCEFIEIQELSGTERGAGGFGHTGK
jgi:dUTP pyrophosphatase